MCGCLRPITGDDSFLKKVFSLWFMPGYLRLQRLCGGVWGEVSGGAGSVMS